jgi:hypothetical protein
MHRDGERTARRGPSLADELLLLAVESSPQARPGRVMDIGALGAEIVDLALTSRVDLNSEPVSVLGQEPTGDRWLDARLADLAARDRPRKLHRYLQQRSGRLRDHYLARLESHGLVELRRGRVLRLFIIKRWFLAEAGAAVGARRRLDAAVRGIAAPDARTAALAALVRATRLDRALYPGRGGRADRAQLERLGRGQPVGEAVAKAIAGLNSH